MFKKLKKMREETGKGLWANAADDYSMWKAQQICKLLNYYEKKQLERTDAQKKIQSDKNMRPDNHIQKSKRHSIRHSPVRQGRQHDNNYRDPEAKEQ